MAQRGSAKGEPRRGGRQKGSRNRKTFEIKTLAGEYTEEALLVLARIMRDPKSGAPARVSAAKELLDRGHGRPAQTHTGPAGGPITVEIVRFSDGD